LVSSVVTTKIRDRISPQAISWPCALHDAGSFFSFIGTNFEKKMLQTTLKRKQQGKPVLVAMNCGGEQRTMR
jgi:hypothetical protein